MTLVHQVYEGICTGCGIGVREYCISETTKIKVVCHVCENIFFIKARDMMTPEDYKRYPL